MPCRAHLGEVADAVERFEAAGARILVVSFEAPERIALFQEELCLPFEVAGDGDRSAYEAYGLMRGSRRQIFHPRTALRYARLLLKGDPLKSPTKGVDLYQLGGDFVVDPRGRLAYTYRSERPDDRPPVEALLGAMVGS